MLPAGAGLRPGSWNGDNSSKTPEAIAAAPGVNRARAGWDFSNTVVGRRPDQARATLHASPACHPVSPAKAANPRLSFNGLKSRLVLQTSCFEQLRSEA